MGDGDPVQGAKLNLLKWRVREMDSMLPSPLRECTFLTLLLFLNVPVKSDSRTNPNSLFPF